MTRIYLCFLAFILLSCQGNDSKKTKHNFGYPELSQLFTAQQQLLLKNSAGLQKRATLNKQTEEATILPNNVEWAKELSVFQELDLNKPSYIGFIKKDSLPTSSGYTITYTTDKQTIAIKKLILNYNTAGTITSLNADIIKANELSSTEKHLQATFSVTPTEAILQQYSIESIQKVVLKDELYTKILGTILIQ
jgi:hypothetical protein